MHAQKGGSILSLGFNEMMMFNNEAHYTCTLSAKSYAQAYFSVVMDVHYSHAIKWQYLRL